MVILWAHTSQPYKRHLDRFSRFAGLTNVINRRTQTDHATPFVALDRIVTVAVRPKNVNAQLLNSHKVTQKLSPK